VLWVIVCVNARPARRAFVFGHHRVAGSKTNYRVVTDRTHNLLLKTRIRPHVVVKSSLNDSIVPLRYFVYGVKATLRTPLPICGGGYVIFPRKNTTAYRMIYRERGSEGFESVTLEPALAAHRDGKISISDRPGRASL
jgi:hypothetical protein